MSAERKDIFKHLKARIEDCLKILERIIRAANISSIRNQLLEATAELSSYFKEILLAAKEVEKENWQYRESLAKFGTNLKQIHRLNTTDYQTLDELLSDYLETGCEILELETGIFGHLVDRSYVIVSVNSKIKDLIPGLEFSIKDTYCYQVVKQKKTIAYTRVGEIAELRSLPVYQNLKFESYIGSPVFVDGETYGTLTFCSTKIKNKNFQEWEKEIVELMAKSIGKYIIATREKEELQRQSLQTNLFAGELQRQNLRARLLAQVTLKIRQSLQLKEILATAVTEVKSLLEVDRVSIVQLEENDGVTVKEAICAECQTMLEREIADFLLRSEYLQEYRQGRLVAISDLKEAMELFSKIEIEGEFGIKTSLVAPVFTREELWGLLVLHQCHSSRQWQEFDIELSKQLADQIGIAISQAQLLEHLEDKVARGTAALTDTNEQLQREMNDRARAREALRRSEEQLRLITNALPVSIAYVDNQQRYRFNNSTYARWWGRSSPQMDGIEVREVMGTENYRQIKEYIEAALSGQRVTYEKEISYTDGKTRWVSGTYIPDFDEQGQVKGYFALISDHTERKSIELIKDRFISIVSHELRTPLTSIHGSLKLLATGKLGHLYEEGQQMLTIADENTDRLVRLVNDVLDFQRMQSGKVRIVKTRCDAGELMLRATEAMQAIAFQHEITLLTDPVSISLLADPDYILQVFINLLGNAIKFSPPGNSVWTSAEVYGDRVLFKVKDRGVGIPPEKLEIIFECFEQVDTSDSRSKEGTGLGLAICRQIVELHGGKIWAESIPNEGSTFYFTLVRN